MRIRIVLVGKTVKQYFSEAEKVYFDRLSRYVNVDRLEIPDIKKASTLSDEELKKREGEQILSKIDKTDLVVLLDETGKSFSSLEFSKWIENKMNYEQRDMVFVIGGAYGFSDEVYQRAETKISLSKMTFNHQMVRMIFFEQLYRALSIIRNEPYHHR